MNSMRKNLLLSIVVIFVGLAIAGGTFAWLTGTLNVTNGNYAAVSDCFLIDYNVSELENNIGANLFSNLTTSGVGVTKLDDGSINVERTQASSGDTFQTIALNSNKVSGGHYVVGFTVSGLEEGQVAVFGIYVSGSGIVGKKTLVNGYNALFFESQNTTNLITIDEYETGSTNDFNINISGFIVYIQSQDITGTMFPSSNPSRGLNGSVGLKVNSSCNTYGTGTIKLHVDNTTSSTLTTPIASYCESKKTLQKIDGISTKEACTTANGIWRGYGDSYCENPTTLERITTYTSQSDCTSNGGSWQTGGSPLKYAVYNADDITQNPILVGHIASSDIGHDITLKDDIVISEVQKYFYIYIWLDGYMTDNRFSNLPFSGSISASAIQNNGGVPSGYQRVEYLGSKSSSNGLFYIDSGINASNNIAIEVDGYVIDPVSLYGVQKRMNATGLSSGAFVVDYYNNTRYTLSVPTGERHVFKQSSNLLYIDGNLIRTFTSYDFTTNLTMLLFARRNINTGNVEDYGRARIYSAKLWNNSSLVRDFIPCYNKTTLVRGLYDTVTDTFYTNAGSGTFEIGPDV